MVADVILGVPAPYVGDGLVDLDRGLDLHGRPPVYSM
jgi:hypothetical protein